MHILVTNDDGPPSNQSSPYIHSFVKTLQSAGHTVSVILPHQQRSWIAKAHFASQVVKPTYFRPGTLHRDDGSTYSKPLQSNDSKDNEEWVLVNSTPATAAQLGLFHFFQDRGPVDLVVSGPNYGRNTTSLFSLSSGTIGGAMEAAVCRKRAIALSYAFFSRDHDPKIIAGASRVSVKLIEHLMGHWDEGVDLYSVNVPLVEGVEGNKVMYTYALQNYWKSGSSFTEVAAEDEEEDPEEREMEIRQREEVGLGSEGEERKTRHKHRHFKWTPHFADVYQSVESSEPGNDGWAVKEGLVSVTPLKSNFMHVAGLQGELKLSLQASPEPPALYACVNYEDSYTQPLILKALSSACSSIPYTTIGSIDELPTPNSPFLQISSYETLPFEHLLDHSTTSLACSYIIRKALIRKHYLAHTVQSYLAKHPESVLKDRVPITVDLELDYAEFLDEALVEAYDLHESFARNEGRAAKDREWWILKPAMSDRGQGIRLFSTEQELHHIFQAWEQDGSDSEDEAAKEDEDSHADNRRKTATTSSPTTSDPLSKPSASHPLSTNREGTPPNDKIITSQLRHFVAQPYIPPLLLPAYKNRKFHIRTYVLCVSALRVYVYEEMLALFAAVPYRAPGTIVQQQHHPSGSGEGNEDDITSVETMDMLPHLTNTCLQSISTSPSTTLPPPPLVLPLSTLVLPLSTLASSSSSSPLDTSNIKSHIFSATADIFRAAVAQPTTFQPLPNAFEIFGVDWLVDTGMGVHLLEFNAYPDFRQSGAGGGREVVEGLWRGVVGVVVNGDGDGDGDGDGGEGFFGGGVGVKGGDGEGEGDCWRGRLEGLGMKKVLEMDMKRR